MNTGQFNHAVHRMPVIPVKAPFTPLLLDVTSDIIGQLNRRIVIPLLPVDRYPAGRRPDRLVPVVRLTDGQEYAVMTHELASVPVRALGRCSAMRRSTALR